MKPITAIDEFLRLPPFTFDSGQKKEILNGVMRVAFEHHMRNNPLFKTFCGKQDYSLGRGTVDLSRFPYLPASLFKSKELLSVPINNIKTRLSSSATSGIPSTILIDEITSRRQTIASAKVIADYIGPNRRPFLILDENPMNRGSTVISARSAATRGFLLFADTVKYLLKKQNGRITLDLLDLKRHLKKAEIKGEEICLLGFTYILYAKVIKPLKESRTAYKLSKDSKVIHIGGWKKLEDQKVSREAFLHDIQKTLGISKKNVFDFYGFTEQMGLVYGNRGNSPKTVSLYSEVIVRDFQTLRPARDGEAGLLQFLTPLPHSYPGISVLTDDVGRITGRGKDGEGRWGTQFEIVGRAQKAEIRSCGDILGQILDEPLE